MYTMWVLVEFSRKKKSEVGLVKWWYSHVCFGLIGISSHVCILCLFLSILDDPISVNLVSRPSGLDINAAESLSLTCQASGGTGAYSYRWSSNCTGNCFLSSGNVVTQTVTRDPVRSADSGFYTCRVTDNAGNNGSNSTQIQVIGTYAYGMDQYLMHFTFTDLPSLYYKA